MLRSIDPANGRELAQFPELDAAGIEAATARAWGSRHAWRDIGVDMRATLLRSVAGGLGPVKAPYSGPGSARTGKSTIVACGGEGEEGGGAGPSRRKPARPSRGAASASTLH